MKKIDKLVITSFAGPFLIAFGIAMFVLIMQFLWLYIDEIAGKGVSIFTMAELIGYLSIAMFPMALPIAVLISSVMLMGNFAERYELSSMKSAGLSLLRVMRSLMIVCAGIAIFSYICSDFLIPAANLKFKSRLYDIRKQKPALTLEKGVFNQDFRNFVIFIRGKEEDGETIKNVMIDDATSYETGMNKILADSGQMYTTTDKRFFVMNLFNGTQYQEPKSESSGGKRKYPFVRTNFKEWSKVFDLSEFDFKATDEDRFKNQRTMLSMQQLRDNIDSMHNKGNRLRSSMTDEMLLPLQQKEVKSSPAQSNPTPTKEDSISMVMAKADTINTTRGGKSPQDSTRLSERVKMSRIKEQQLNKQQGGIVQPAKPRIVPQLPLGNAKDLGSFLYTFVDSTRRGIAKTANSNLKANLASFNGKRQTIEDHEIDAIKMGYELYSKYSFALVCLVFLFIGAPMGAIIRKGGFGYPVLVSIGFFMVFIFLTILCRELAEGRTMPPFWAAMVPCLVLMPIAAVLTIRAMNDRSMMEINWPSWKDIKQKFSRTPFAKTTSN